MESEFVRVSVEILIILVAAKLIGELFERFGQSAVVGELLIGMILGPNVLHLINPQESIVISYLAELGIIVLLFYVGIESELEHLLRSWRPVLAVALIGVLVPLLLGASYSLAVGHELLLALFVGATLTATSIGITVRVLSDLGKINKPEGHVILGAAVIDDIVGLIMLSVLGAIVVQGTLSAMAIGKPLGLSILFLATSITLGIRFAPFLFRLVQRMYVRGILIATAFVYCLTLSLLSLKIGLAPLIGAFAAGLMLEYAEEEKQIARKIEPLVDLFVPFYFVQSGALLAPAAFLQWPVLLSVLVLFLIVMVGKLLSGLGAWRSGANGWAVGVGMIPLGEVGLIFVTFGLTQKLLSQELYATLLAVIILTTFVTPLLLKPLLKITHTPHSQ